MPNLQKWKDQIFKQIHLRRVCAWNLCWWEIPYLSAENEDVCLEISRPGWEGCWPRRGTASWWQGEQEPGWLAYEIALKKQKLVEWEWDWHDFDHKWIRKKGDPAPSSAPCVLIINKSSDWMGKKSIPEAFPKHKLCRDWNELEAHKISFMCTCSAASWQWNCCSIKG